MQLSEKPQFRFDIDELEQLISNRTRMIIINSPHNPTGGALTEATSQRIAELAIEHDMVVLADEIYSDIVYEGEHHTISSSPA